MEVLFPHTFPPCTTVRAYSFHSTQWHIQYCETTLVVNKMAISGAEVSLDEFHEWWPVIHTTMVIATSSTALWGLNISLAISCLKHVWSRHKSFASKVRLWGSCLYICTMIAFASLAVIQLHIDIIDNIKLSFLQFLTIGTSVDNDTWADLPPSVLPSLPLALPLSVWGADGVLVRDTPCHLSCSSDNEAILSYNAQIWRCIILYRETSRSRKISLYVLLGVFASASLGQPFFQPSLPSTAIFLYLRLASGIISYLLPHDFAGITATVSALLPITCATNGIITILISARLIRAHRLLSGIQSQSGVDNVINGNWHSPYLTALAICVESSAIIVITAIFCIVPRFDYFPTLILPQICVSDHYIHGNLINLS